MRPHADGLSRERCVAILEAYGFQVYDHETVEELRTAIEVNVLDGTISLLDLSEEENAKGCDTETR